MKEKMTKAVANWLLHDDMETEELYEVYVYGLEQIFSNLFSILTALAIGFLFGEVLISIVYVAAFTFLRSYTGGYHASTPMGCYVLTVASIIAALLVVKYVSFSVFGLASLFIMSSIVILMLSPVDTANKRLDEIEHIHYHKMAIIVWAVEFLIVISTAVLHSIPVLESIIFSQLTIAMSLIYGELQNHFNK